MRRHPRIITASCLVLAAVAPSAAGQALTHQTSTHQASSRDAFWRHVQDICNATSNIKTVDRIEPHAELIAAAAEHEHRLWGGHKIDHTGRLYRFGLVETENEQDPGPSSTVPLQKIGWWNVWRYLSVLGEAGRIHLDFLRVTSIEGAIDARNPDGTGERRSNAIGNLFAATDQIDNAERREATKESVIRGAIADRPWSAVFISYVMHTAVGATVAKTPQQFAYSPIHIDYIRQAFQASVAEEQGSPTASVYRACPAHETTPRRGDLICYHRQKPCEGMSARAIQNLVGFGDRPNEQCKSIIMSHCEVVTDVDKDAKKVYTVGGNVLQSVTERRMNLTARGLKFSSIQGDKDCSTAQRAGGINAAPQERCSLNDKDWFVILQARPAGALAGGPQQP
jgi:hypothetical protein